MNIVSTRKREIREPFADNKQTERADFHEMRDATARRTI